MYVSGGVSRGTALAVGSPCSGLVVRAKITYAGNMQVSRIVGSWGVLLLLVFFDYVVPLSLSLNVCVCVCVSLCVCVLRNSLHSCVQKKNVMLFSFQ